MVGKVNVRERLKRRCCVVFGSGKNGHPGMHARGHCVMSFASLMGDVRMVGCREVRRKLR
jgi:hypothetical protein